MDIWKKYKSPLGYETGNNGIDSYGVNHSGFSLRDEIEYQTARADRENKLIQDYNNQGITGNYPQVGTSFWGNPENNYGFGSSNISSAISTHPAMNTTPTPLQTVQKSNQAPTMSAFTDTFGGYGTSDDSISGYQTAPKQNTVNTVPAPRTSTGEILLEGVKGFGKGIENGVLRGLNAATLGLYDLGNYYFLGNQYADKQSELQAQSEAVGLGGLNKLSNYAIDIGMGGKGSKKLLKSLLRYCK